MAGSGLKANIIPGMRYRDAPAAIEWLCDFLGFERHLVVPNEDGTIAHAQLVLGNGMIMLGLAHDDDFGDIVGPPVAGSNADAKRVHCGAGCARSLRTSPGRRRQHRHGVHRAALRRKSLRGPRPRGTALEHRKLRPVGGTGSSWLVDVQFERPVEGSHGIGSLAARHDASDANLRRRDHLDVHARVG